MRKFSQPTGNLVDKLQTTQAKNEWAWWTAIAGLV